MIAQLVCLELASVGVDGVERGEFQRHIDYGARWFSYACGRGCIADRIKTLVANVGDDTDSVVHRVDVFLGADFDLLRCAADNIAQHLSPKSLMRIVF